MNLRRFYMTCDFTKNTLTWCAVFVLFILITAALQRSLLPVLCHLMKCAVEGPFRALAAPSRRCGAYMRNLIYNAVSCYAGSCGWNAGAVEAWETYRSSFNSVLVRPYAGVPACSWYFTILLWKYNENLIWASSLQTISALMLTFNIFMRVFQG